MGGATRRQFVRAIGHAVPAVSWLELGSFQRTAAPGILWRADHEGGDLSEWYADYGGGEFNSGAARSDLSQEVAHSGRYSVKCTISTSPSSGVRLVRWNEGRSHPECYYSVWYYVPQLYAAAWWNIFQFKSRNGPSVNDPFWFLQIGNRPTGAMHLFLYWWNGLSIEGPRRGEFGGRAFTQTLKDVPVGQWTHIEMFLRQSSGFSGQVIAWQDGVELFNQTNVRTRYAAANGANEWSVNNYGDAIRPNPTSVYVDDAVISTTRMGRPAASVPATPTGLKVVNG
jgi:hypothetical protein